MRTDAIIAEAAKRNYDESETLAVLTLAIWEKWSENVDVVTFFDKFDFVRRSNRATADPWYNLAALRGEPPIRWQVFKTRLYVHIRAAVALLTPEDDLLPALNDDEQRELLTLLRGLKDTAEDARQIRLQLGARAASSWPSLGLNAKGEELTLRDAFGVLKTDVAAIKQHLGL